MKTMTWKKGGDGTWWFIAGKFCEITLEPRPHYCDRGHWIAKLHPHGRLILEIDGQDGWPRYYFDFERAKLECEDWIKWREQNYNPPAAKTEGGTKPVEGNRK